MKRMLLAFLLGTAAGAGGYWYYDQGAGKAQLEQTQAKVVFEAGRISGVLQEKTSDLSIETIKDELARTSMVVREKAQSAGRSIADTTQNTRTTATIKARLLTEPGFPSLGINVDTTDGLVTLSGKVNTPEQVAQAVKMAIQTEGVHKVISTLQVTATRL